jgi:acyl transferase domain-containing protein
MRTQHQELIAIVGAGCRFPGGITTVRGYWELLAEGGNVIAEVPGERWDRAALHSEDPAEPGKMNCLYGGFLDDIAGFDADFFGVSPREARQLDPQQRLLLEVCWESLTDAGVAPSALEGTRTSIHTGSISNDYLLMHNRSAGLPGIDPWYATGKEFSFGPGRVAHLLGTNGPAFSISAACSSGLVGVHLASQELRAGNTDLALVASASLMLSPELSVFMSKVGALAPDGRCKVFDALADGTVRSEGAVCIVLKRLTDAVADGDRVLAVVRGSAVNHNGRSAGLTVPNARAQRALIEQAVHRAGVPPEAIGYLEAHGTGTALGDPIEMSAAAAALASSANRTEPLLVGSVKTNLGHTDTVAGLAGLLKAALVLQHGLVPAHLHLSRPHPGIRWDVWPVAVPTKPTRLRVDAVRSNLAGVSAFGLSGTNAHVVLEQAPKPAPIDHGQIPERLILPLSARRPAALAELAARHLDELEWERCAAELLDYTRTAGRHREHYREHRGCVTGRDVAELRAGLRELAGESGGPDKEPGCLAGVVLVCSGQGEQWPDMARALRTEPAFRNSLAEVDELIMDRAGWSVTDELDANNPRFHPEAEFATEFAQPVIFAVQVALAAQWKAWGIRPDAVMGHSMGEVAAAQIGGVLSMPDAVDVIVSRGRLLADAHGKGRMLAVELPPERALRLCGDSIELAAVNAAHLCVLSGPPEAVEQLRRRLDAEGVRSRIMPGEYAFHNSAMWRYAWPLATEIAHIRPLPSAISVVACTRPDPAVEVFGPAYWAANVVQPVLFGAGARELVEQGNRVFIELGPHPVLQRSLRSYLGNDDSLVIGSLRRGTDGLATMLDGLAALYRAGLDVDWPRVGGKLGRRAVQPLYPWQREHFWFDVPTPPHSTPPHSTSQSGAPALVVAPLRAPPRAEQDSQVTAERDIEDLVADAVAAVLDVPVKRIRRNQGFAEMGMDSLTAVELATLLGTRLGVSLSETVAFDHPTVRKLTSHLRQQQPAGGTAPPGKTEQELPDGAIAVVGMGCRLPGGVSGPDDYWRLLRDSVDAVGDAPLGRFGEPGHFPGGYLDDVYEFDARFFAVSPKEAKAMDPQQRLFLEVAWEALEDAGFTAPEVRNTRTGVFVGMNSHDYAVLASIDPEALDGYYGTGNSFSGSSGRLAYFLGATGPNLAVDTACSSSLVAVHLAVRSLRSGESEMAIVGGVNLMLRTTIHRSSEALGALSPSGRCRTFDESADGYIRGEGCGVVILKRLADAMADGDQVHAVLLGTSVNSDGASSGLTVPNGPAQQDVLRAALADARVGPAQIDYVETHGTGTILGDAIELQALGAVLGESDRSTPCLVGSVKANLGHLEAASGIAGLIKSVLVLAHGQVPANVHFTRPTSRVPWSVLPLRVPTELTDLDHGRIRFAGVSSFGFTGTNAHAVLASSTPVGDERDPRPVEPTSSDAVLVLPVSAPTHTGLVAQARALCDHLVEHPELDTADVCFTAARHRTHFEQRGVAVGRNSGELISALSMLAGAGQGLDTQVTGTADSESGTGLAFVCSGHGGYWSGAGSQLYAAEPAFAAAVDRVSSAMQPYLGWSLAERIAAGEEVAAEHDQQALIFVLQVALAELWTLYGVRPVAVVGHSMGEPAAAYLAGVLDLTSAARLMALRCKQVKKLMGNGGMALVGLDAERTEIEIADFADRLWVAVNNSFESTVISGDVQAVETVRRRLRARNVFCRRIHAGGAGHCPLVEHLAADLADDLAWLRPQRGSIAFYSAVTGQREDEPLDADYWRRNLRDRVRFDAAVRALAGDGIGAFVELSAHPLLGTALDQELALIGSAATVVSSLSKDCDETVEIALNAARLHVRGHDVDLTRLLPPARQVRIPHYAWEHRPYRVDSIDSAVRRVPSGQLLDTCTEFDGVWYAQATVDEALLQTVGARRYEADALCPPSVLLAMAVAGARRRYPATTVSLGAVRFPMPLVVGVGQTRTVQIGLSPASDTDTTVTVRSRGMHRKQLILTGVLRAGGVLPANYAAGEVQGCTGPEPEQVPLPPDEQLDLPDGLRVLAAHRAGAQLRVVVAAQARPAARGQHHPIAACLRAAELAARQCCGFGGSDAELEVREIGDLVVSAWFDDPAPTRWTVRVTGLRRDATAAGVALDVALHDESGQCLIRASHVRVVHSRLVSLDTAQRQRVDSLVYRDTWREVPLSRLPRQREGDAPARRWLIIGDPGGLGTALRDRLICRGDAARLLTGGAELLSTVGDRSPETGIGVVIYLAPIPLNDIDQHLAFAEPVEQPEGARQHAVAAIRELAATADRQGPRCYYVTRGAYPEQRGGADPVQRAVWTTARQIAIEHPRAWGGLIDLDPIPQEPAVLAEQLLEQVLAADGEDHICLRGRTRLARRVVVEQETVSVYLPVELSPRASYLVADAQPAVALAVGRWLAERGARNLVFCGVDQDQLDRSALDMLSWYGVEVRCARRDLADPTAVSVLAHLCFTEGRPVRGVVWAGVDWRLDDQRPNSTAEFLHRVRAAWNLHDQCTDLELFVVFSTAATSWGARGAGGQAAADGILRALVDHRLTRGLPVTGVAWGPWDTPDSVDAVTRRILARTGVRPLPVDDAILALDQLVARGAGATTVVDADRQLLVSMYSQAGPWPLFAELTDGLTADVDTEDLAKQLARLTPAACTERLLGAVCAELAVILGVDHPDEIEPDEGFFALGMNSIGAMELRVRLQRRFGVVLPSTAAFEHPNPAALATRVGQLLGLDRLGVLPTEPEPTPAAEGLIDRFEREMAAAAGAMRRESR